MFFLSMHVGKEKEALCRVVLGVFSLVEDNAFGGHSIYFYRMIIYIRHLCVRIWKTRFHATNDCRHLVYRRISMAFVFSIPSG